MIGDCKIILQKGMSIGYHSDLAAIADEIELGEGTHYLLARNGRGKTTLLRTLAGILKVRSGSFKAQGNIQFIPEDISYNDHLRSVDIFRCLIPKSRRADCLAFADTIELDVKKCYRSLSTGNKRKISWLMAEFSCDLEQSNILLLDEPFTGVDSFVRDKFMEYWESNREGICRLVSCHPDYDSMNIESAVLISDGVISAPTIDEVLSWGDLKGQLA